MLRAVLICCFIWSGMVPTLAAGGTLVRQNSSVVFQDSLFRLGEDMYQKPSESERLSANFAFIKTLVAALKQPHSFDFKFDALEMVSIQESPDGQFRIFSWPIRLSDGSYLYYGTIQMRTSDGTLKLYPLLDKTYEITDPDREIGTAKDWYGAQYYEIIPHAGSYLLLGWKGHNPSITQKVIDVLTFDTERDIAIFGKKMIFDAPEYQEHARVIFRFATGISMHLSYQPGLNRIVFAHLVPSDPRYRGQFEHYGPDLTFDAWILESKKLRLVKETDYQ